MTEIKVEIDDDAVRRRLNQLVSAGADLSPAMREIAGKLEADADAAFERQQDPDGTPWAPLSAVTLARRAAKRPSAGTHNILHDEGDLVGSISSRFGARHAEVGSGEIYAATHQFGAAKGAFGSTARGAPIPWGDIPARPFLGLSAEGEDEVVDILRRHILPGAVA